MSATEELAGYLTALTYHDIPESVRERTKAVVLDHFGTLLAGTQYPVGSSMQQFAARMHNEGPCSVAGTDLRVSPITAAMANAAISHCLELDDNYNPANAHVANVVVPAAVAAGEQCNATGKDLITAIVAAYDIEGRVGIALDPVKLYERSFHPSSVAGNFGATAAAASILKLDQSQNVRALGLAGCQASGLLAWVTEAAQFSKSFQIGIASRNGITAALLASEGASGPPHIFEGNHNIFQAFVGEWRAEELTQELGKRFEISRTSLKKYACCRQIHAPLDGMFKIMQENDLNAEDLAEISIRVATSMADIIDQNELPSHNAQYVMATAAYDGLVEVEQLDGHRMADERVASLSRKVSVHGDAELETLFPERWSGITTVRTRDGREMTEVVYFPSGDPENFLSDNEIGEKFMSLASKAIPL